MTTINANNFENVTSGHEIKNREIQKLLLHFLINRDRQSHDIFRDDRSFKLGVIEYTLDTAPKTPKPQNPFIAPSSTGGFH